MSRLVDIDNYLVLENGTIKETSFKQDIQIQNQTLMINEDAKVQIIYKTTEEGTYQFNIEIKDRLHVDLVEMYEASKSCSYTKNIKINESSEVLRYVEKNSHQNIQLDLDENVDVYKYARVSCAYVELTDYTTLSKIKYRLLEEEASVKLRLASLSKEKENNHYEGECYYALVKANSNAISDVKAGVTDDILDATVKVQPLEETRTSAFAINPDKTPLYRRFNNANLGEADGRDTLRFYENVRHEYLMDENNKEGGLTDEFVNYVGMWTADKATGLAFQIDTTWVVRGRGYIKPQYLISVAHNDFAGIEGTPCTEDGPHITPDGQITDDPMACKHAHPAIPGFERAKYMVSFQDSVAVYGQDKPYADVAGGYTRVGFVEGIRVADTLWILPAQYRSVANDKVNFATLQAYNDSVVAKGLPAIKNLLTEDVHKNYVWSFRYVHPEKANNVTEEGLENSFLFESNIWPNSATTVNESIAPTEKAAWLKIQNGCVVLTDDKSTFANAKTGGDGALVFNVENKENDQLATDNETITTSEVTVIAGNGNVQVVGAEGKKVVITNILGQTVANTVITSDNATIAAPQGVVVVAVEGEEAVKAIVK